LNKVAQTKRRTQGGVAILLVFAASLFFRGPQQGEGEPQDVGQVEDRGLEIALRLVSESGEPIACAGTLWRQNDGSRRASEESTEWCVDGWLKWRGVAPGKYRLMTQAEGMQLVEKDVEIASESIHLGEIALKPGRSIEGQVVLAGKPIEGALVLVEGGRRTQTDADGHFFFRGLPLAPLALRAAAQGGRGALELSAKDSTGLVVRLERGRGQGLLGLRFERQDKGPVVTGLLAGTAAADQLEPGDLLLKVDGVEVCEMSTEEIALVLAGQIDSLAVLEIDRGGATQHLEMRRIDPIELTKQ
jgi:hypothetical protein